jgi:hypothetical protein
MQEQHTDHDALSQTEGVVGVARHCVNGSLESSLGFHAA